MKQFTYLILTLLIITSSKVVAQKHTNGFIDFGLVSLEGEGKEAMAPEMLTVIEENVEVNAGMDIYFIQEKLAVFKVDQTGDTMRSVYDLESRKIYEFWNNEGQAVFSILDMPGESIDFKNPLGIEDFGAPQKLDKQMYGLECEKYTIEMGGKTITFIMTKDLDLPALQELSPMPKENGVMVHTIIEDPAEKMTITMGIRSFLPNIENSNRFSIDTTGMVDYRK